MKCSSVNFLWIPISHLVIQAFKPSNQDLSLPPSAAVWWRVLCRAVSCSPPACQCTVWIIFWSNPSVIATLVSSAWNPLYRLECGRDAQRHKSAYLRSTATMQIKMGRVFWNTASEIDSNRVLKRNEASGTMHGIRLRKWCCYFMGHVSLLPAIIRSTMIWLLCILWQHQCRHRDAASETDAHSISSDQGHFQTLPWWFEDNNSSRQFLTRLAWQHFENNMFFGCCLGVSSSGFGDKAGCVGDAAVSTLGDAVWCSFPETDRPMHLIPVRVADSFLCLVLLLEAGFPSQAALSWQTWLGSRLCNHLHAGWLYLLPACALLPFCLHTQPEARWGHGC